MESLLSCPHLKVRLLVKLAQLTPLPPEEEQKKPNEKKTLFVHIGNNPNRQTVADLKHKKQTKETKNMKGNSCRTGTNILMGNTAPLMLNTWNQFNSHCPQIRHCWPLSSSFWLCWDSSGKPDYHSARCSSYGQSTSMCSFCPYPDRKRKDTVTLECNYQPIRNNLSGKIQLKRSLHPNYKSYQDHYG